MASPSVAELRFRPPATRAARRRGSSSRSDEAWRRRGRPKPGWGFGIGSKLLPILAAAAIAGTSGCRLGITRYRAGKPVQEQSFEDLRVDVETREEVVDRLGAPEKVEWKNGKEYLWYLYADDVDVSLRFLFPPFRTLLGYQHSFLTLLEGSDDVNALLLVFDDAAVLRYKSLRLSRAYKYPPSEAAGRSWAARLTPYFEQSLFLLGDGGFRDYSEIFEPGYRAGLRAGIQPFPILALFIGGNYQRLDGKTERTSQGRAAVGDLELFQAEIGVHVGIPVALFFHLDDFEEVKSILFDEQPRGLRGFRIYLEGMTGFTVSRDVSIRIDGVPGGNLYDSSIGLSGAAGAGLEYEWSWGGVHLGVGYQGIDGFEEGSSPYDANAGALESFYVGGGLTLKL